MEIHERFVCGTSTLHDYLIELGYMLWKDTGKGSRRERIYRIPKKGAVKFYNKEIIDDHYHITLYLGPPGNLKKQKEEYRGYTISKDLLTFFSQRGKV